MSEGLTEEQLLRGLRAEGYRVSRDQLKRWRRAGLIPRPTQVYLSGRPGSETSYPPGTLTMAVEVCRTHERFKVLERVRFELWWAGNYTGDLEPVRRYLVDRLNQLLSPIRELRDEYDDPFDAAEAAVNGNNLASRDPVIRTVRRLAKTDENLRSTAFAIFAELFGGEVAWDFPDTGAEANERDLSLRELVEQALGVRRAKKDMTDSGQPLLDPAADLVGVIQLTYRTGVIDLDHPGSAIAGSSDDALNRARVTARSFIEGLASYARVSAIRRSWNFAGLRVLAGLNATDPTLIALAMQIVLHLPLLLLTDQQRANAAKTLAALERQRASLRCIELFSKAHPGYAFIFDADQSRVQALTAEERELLAKIVDKFLQNEPECAALTAADH